MELCPMLCGSLDVSGVWGRMDTYIWWLSPFNVHLKLSQCCWSAILQYNIKKFKKKKNLSVNKLVKGGTWERSQGDHTPPVGTFIFLQGNYVRVNPPDSVKMRLRIDFTALSVRPGITHQFKSHQSCRTWATWSRKQQSLRRWCYWASHPLTRMGGGKAPENRDGPSGQVCAKPYSPDDHRSGEGILQVNIFKRNLLFPRRLCSPNIMYFNANQNGLQKVVMTVKMLGFFKTKSLTGTVMVSSGVSLDGPVSNDSTKHLSRCYHEGSLSVWFTSIIRTSGEEITLNTMVASSS